MLNKKSIDDINVKGRRVLVRCDFNVPLKNGVITDETTGQVFTAQPFPPFIADIIEQGGLINRTRSVLGKE